MEDNMEENFLELLDNYLDEEEIKRKIQNDEIEEENTKKNMHTEAIFSIEDSISIGRYVNEYLEIPGDCSNLLHCGLKDLQCDYVMGIDNNFANKNPELVKKGFLLLVIDSHNNRGTYVNPFYLKNFVSNKENIEKEYKVFTKKFITDLKLLEEFYQEYITILDRMKINDRFYKMLEETHKIRSLKKIIGGDNYDKHKGR
jgi:hypothetical protein